MIKYRAQNRQLEIGEVQISGKGFTAYVKDVLNGTVRFVEDITVYALSTLLIPPRVIIELPEVQRVSVNPIMFAVGNQGDYRTWNLHWSTDPADFLWNGQ